MSCIHLKKLYELCTNEGLKISGADMVHIVCKQCGEQEVCPSRLMTDDDLKDEPDSAPPATKSEDPRADSK